MSAARPPRLAARSLARAARLAALAAAAAACGVPPPVAPRSADAPTVQAALAAHLPRAPRPRLGDSALAVLPADVIGGVAAPSLRHVHDRLGLDGLDPELRRALGGVIAGCARVDLADLSAAGRAGVDVDRSLAVAAFAGGVVGLVLPVRDRGAFEAAVEAAAAAAAVDAGDGGPHDDGDPTTCDLSDEPIQTELAWLPGHVVVLFSTARSRRGRSRPAPRSRRSRASWPSAPT
jgi:hypothetical protein